ncbi:MAG TPA: DUF2924 domain-containing protein [Chromatiaceae bacterium]|nr:DUF2924 domain-containing protein [Chromatiaceae bacterium]
MEHVSTDKILSLAAIESACRDQLVFWYQKAFGQSPPTRASLNFLQGNLSWWWQVKQQEKNPKQLRGKLIRSSARKTDRFRQAYAPGTRLVREWQGDTYEVIVLDKGYLWNEIKYRSLSEVARSICGSHVSGPRFFGLRTKAGKHA